MALVWLHALAIPIYGLTRGYSLRQIALESSVLPLAAVVASLSRLPRRLRSLAVAVGLLSASGVLVHLSGGVIEMHFHFFVMVAVIALYQDWLTFLTAIGYVLVHHGVIGALDAESVYNHPAAINNPWKWAAVHAFFVAGASVASVVTWRMNERYLAEITAADQRLREEQLTVKRLNEVGRMLVADLDFEHVVQRVTDVATELTSAAFGAFFYDPDEGRGETYRLHAICGISAEALAGMATPGNTALFRTTFDGASAVRIDDVATDVRVPPDLLLPVRSYLAVPVASRGNVLGGLFFGHPEPGWFTEADEQIATGIAAHAAIAVENAKQFTDKRLAAETLQHALLPDRLPCVPGLDVAARYVPAGGGAEVGGDWYDVIALDDGRVCVVMGDVVGHGIAAASLMGQLRNAVRAYAVDDRAPAELLGCLNALISAIGTHEHMATMVYAVYDPERETLEVANAGHPPPVLRTDDGTAAIIEGGSGVPLGAVAGYAYESTVCPMPPGSTLVLYTDGLVEAPDMPLDAGIGALRVLMANDSSDPDGLCQLLVDRSTGSRPATDDVAVLTLRTSGLDPALHLDVPLEPRALRPLRALLRRWLARAGADELETYEVLVSVTEACSNALRHGHASEEETFSFDAWFDDDLVITVRNAGAWRGPRAQTSGGRGLCIIEEFMDDVEVRRGPPETVMTMRRSLGQRPTLQPNDAPCPIPT